MRPLGKITLAGNRGASRWTLLLALLFLALPAGPAAGVDLTPAEARRIGKKIWQNECGGTVSGLTSWNVGENFASLGIGHFIWYPAGVEGPFDESFPKLVAFARREGVTLPSFLAGHPVPPCPWATRAEFLRERDSSRMKALRQFLADQIDLQARFLVQRLEQALPKMLQAAPSSEHAAIRQNFERVGASAQGCYALIDYVNFKGEGVKSTERYRGEGWGLLQVLAAMREDKPPLPEFSRAAKAVLTQRVKNSPSERNEARWLAGWLKRTDTYARE